jgi:tetratricopeptide (TPR) repeat protein
MSMISMIQFNHWMGSLALLLCIHAPLHARDWVPSHDDQVLVKLAPRLKAVTMTDPEQVLDAAQQAIMLARSTSDPRHLGHAQALLGPWWGRPDAPVRAVVLQATVEQAQHRFAQARVSLNRVVSQDPNHAQAWLTLATLDRLEGRYAEAARACERVEQAGAVLYARICQAEISSMLGRHANAQAAFQQLKDQAPDLGVQAWIYSLLGEAQSRAGQATSAQQSLATSLRLAPDTYSSIALADLLLQAGQAQRALDVLKAEPLSDAVLMRRALARRQNNDSRWQQDLAELEQRFASARLRGDDQRLHARELAWAALHLQDNPQAAQRQALINLKLQKEPIDWWLALRSTRTVADAATWKTLRAELIRSGLRDARLDGLLKAWQP